MQGHRWWSRCSSSHPVHATAARPSLHLRVQVACSPPPLAQPASASHFVPDRAVALRRGRPASSSAAPDSSSFLTFPLLFLVAAAAPLGGSHPPHQDARVSRQKRWRRSRRSSAKVDSRKKKVDSSANGDVDLLQLACSLNPSEETGVRSHCQLGHPAPVGWI